MAAIFRAPRFKLYDYKSFPGYPQQLPHAFTLNSLEECSHFGYKEYMVDVNKAKDAIGDKGVVMASLSGVSLDEWIEMVQLTNETNADWVELNVSCPFAAGYGREDGRGRRRYDGRSRTDLRETIEEALQRENLSPDG